MYASEQISRALSPYVDIVVEERTDPVIESATVVAAGKQTDVTGGMALTALRLAGLRTNTRRVVF